MLKEDIELDEGEQGRNVSQNSCTVQQHPVQLLRWTGN